MHMLKIRCECECNAMDQYSKSNWVPPCFLAWTFWMCNRKQCWSLDHEQRYPNSLQLFIYFVFSNPNQEDYIVIDAKRLVFLWFSQEALVSTSRVLETQYHFFAKPRSHKTPCQALISFSCPHHLLLVFWELMLGYVTLLDWYPNFLMVRFYLKCLFVFTPHSLDWDLNVKTLVGKCIKRWDRLYHKKKLIKTY